MERKEYRCTKEAEISEIKTTLNAIEKVVMGNSHEGLNVTVPLLTQNVKKLSSDMEKYTKVMTDLLEFQQQQIIKEEVAKKEEENEKEEFKKKVRKNNVFIMIYMAIIATLSFIASIMIKGGNS